MEESINSFSNRKLLDRFRAEKATLSNQKENDFGL